MKRILSLWLALCLALGLSGCQSTPAPGLAWDPKEMVELRLEKVHYLVGEKVTREPSEIQAAAQGLQALPVDRPRREEDSGYDGGSSVTFTFFREDGTWEEVSYAFPYLTTNEGEYLVKESAQTTQDHLWDLVDAPVEFPPEKNHAQPDQETAEFFGF